MQTLANTEVGKYALLFQGIYYVITAGWALVDIESFSRFTRYGGDYFLKHTAGVLFLVLGGLFTYAAARNRIAEEVRVSAFLTAVGVMAVEAYYLPRIGNPWPFWVDFGIEGMIVLFLLVLSLKGDPLRS